MLSIPRTLLYDSNRTLKVDTDRCVEITEKGRHLYPSLWKHEYSAASFDVDSSIRPQLTTTKTKPDFLGPIVSRTKYSHQENGKVNVRMKNDNWCRDILDRGKSLVRYCAKLFKF